MPDTVVTSAAFDPLAALSEAVFLFFPGPAQCDVMYIAGTRYKEQEPKTAKSRRKIALPHLPTKPMLQILLQLGCEGPEGVLLAVDG